MRLGTDAVPSGLDALTRRPHAVHAAAEPRRRGVVRDGAWLNPGQSWMPSRGAKNAGCSCVTRSGGSAEAPAHEDPPKTERMSLVQAPVVTTARRARTTPSAPAASRTRTSTPSSPTAPPTTAVCCMTRAPRASAAAANPATARSAFSRPAWGVCSTCPRSAIPASATTPPQRREARCRSLPPTRRPRPVRSPGRGRG